MEAEVIRTMAIGLRSIGTGGKESKPMSEAIKLWVAEFDERTHYQLQWRDPITKGQVGQWHFGKRRPSGADHEEQQPEPIGLDAARSWRCRGASCPRSRPDLSRRLEPALKPLLSRAVGILAFSRLRTSGSK